MLLKNIDIKNMYGKDAGGGLTPPGCCSVGPKVNPPGLKISAAAALGGVDPPPNIFQELLRRWGVNPPRLCVTCCCVETGVESKQN